jgi:repressor LexA
MLTPRLREVLVYIDRYQRAKGGVCPSHDEIAAACALHGRSGVARIVQGLVERGYVRTLGRRARAIEVLKPVPYRDAWFKFDSESKVLRDGQGRQVGSDWDA